VSQPACTAALLDQASGLVGCQEGCLLSRSSS